MKNIKMIKKGKTSFTIVEIMIVSVILGVLATIALTRLYTTVERQRCENAVNNLVILHGGAELLHQQGNSYIFPGFLGAPMPITDLTIINTNLGIDILNDPEFDYAYTSSDADPDFFVATAARSNGNYIIEVGNGPLAANNPHCALAPCPCL